MTAMYPCARAPVRTELTLFAEYHLDKHYLKVLNIGTQPPDTEMLILHSPGWRGNKCLLLGSVSCHLRI
uniref:Uncharacterized protein n=1 Tax=Arundo donax TaxID=35708 RepID=A0A0A9GMG9_ARUDO